MINDIRIAVTEEQSSFKSSRMDELVKEIDSRTVGAELYTTIVRTPDPNGLITRTEYYSDTAKTKMVLKREFTRVSGLGGSQLVASITTTAYNEDGSIDSVITTSITRDATPGSNSYIQSSGAPLTTSEV